MHAAVAAAKYLVRLAQGNSEESEDNEDLSLSTDEESCDGGEDSNESESQNENSVTHEAVLNTYEKEEQPDTRRVEAVSPSELESLDAELKRLFLTRENAAESCSRVLTAICRCDKGGCTLLRYLGNSVASRKNLIPLSELVYTVTLTLVPQCLWLYSTLVALTGNFYIQVVCKEIPSTDKRRCITRLETLFHTLIGSFPRTQVAPVPALLAENGGANTHRKKRKGKGSGMSITPHAPVEPMAVISTLR